MRKITRDNQKVDTIYCVVEENGYEVYPNYFFVTPDGEGRYYYDTLAEALEQHGDLPIVRCEIEGD